MFEKNRQTAFFSTDQGIIEISLEDGATELTFAARNFEHHESASVGKLDTRLVATMALVMNRLCIIADANRAEKESKEGAKEC